MIDLAIIGGGPAGLSAGLYATRGGVADVVLFEKGMPGGQIVNSSEIENYPGVEQIVSGMDFMQPWLNQCFRFGLKHEMVEVERVSVSSTANGKNVYQIHHSNGKIVEARAVIYTTGGRPRLSGVEGESKFYGNGVHTCATCDGMFYKNKEVAVIGGGDTALEEAIYLAKICKKVYLVHRREEFRAAPVTVAHARSNDKIEFILNSALEEIIGDEGGVTGLKLKSTTTGEISTLNVPGVFLFIGYDLNTNPLKGEDGTPLVETDKLGAISVDLSMKTNLAGFFAAGDIRSAAAKQVVCAAGDGATAALSAIAYLEHH